MKYRVQLDLLFDTDLNAKRFLDSVEHLKQMVTKPRNQKGVPTERKCVCLVYEDGSNTGNHYDSVDMDAPKKIHIQANKNQQ